jgi:hypothetical protein
MASDRFAVLREQVIEEGDADYEAERQVAALSGYTRPESRTEATLRAACRGSAGSPAGRLPLSHSVANPWTRDHAASPASCASGSDSEAANGAAPP